MYTLRETNGLFFIKDASGQTVSETRFLTDKDDPPDAFVGMKKPEAKAIAEKIASLLNGDDLTRVPGQSH